MGICLNSRVLAKIIVVFGFFVKLGESFCDRDRPEFLEHDEIFFGTDVVVDNFGGGGSLVDAVPHELLGNMNKITREA